MTAVITIIRKRSPCLFRCSTASWWCDPISWFLPVNGTRLITIIGLNCLPPIVRDVPVLVPLKDQSVTSLRETSRA